MPKSVFAARFWTCDDEGDVEDVWLHERELTGLQIKTSEALASEVFELLDLCLAGGEGVCAGTTNADITAVVAHETVITVTS